MVSGGMVYTFWCSTRSCNFGKTLEQVVERRGARYCFYTGNFTLGHYPARSEKSGRVPESAIVYIHQESIVVQEVRPYNCLGNVGHDEPPWELSSQSEIHSERDRAVCCNRGAIRRSQFVVGFGSWSW